MNKYKKAYILGIGGTGMSSIAKYLSQSGLSVKGYDQRRSYITNALEQDEISIDFQVEDIVYKKDTLYIFSTAFDISKTNLGAVTDVTDQFILINIKGDKIFNLLETGSPFNFKYSPIPLVDILTLPVFIL